MSPSLTLSFVMFRAGRGLNFNLSSNLLEVVGFGNCSLNAEQVRFSEVFSTVLKIDVVLYVFELFTFSTVSKIFETKTFPLSSFQISSAGGLAP